MRKAMLIIIMLLLAGSLFAQELSPERIKELEGDFPTRELYIQGIIDAEDWLFHLDATTGHLGMGEAAPIKGTHIAYISELLLFGRNKRYITDEQYRQFRSSDLLKVFVFHERNAVVWNEFRGNR